MTTLILSLQKLGKRLKVKKKLSLLAVTLVSFLWMSFNLLPMSAMAQELIPHPDKPFTGKIGLSFKDSEPVKPELKLPQNYGIENPPNILLVLIDDVGYGQFGTFGGGIPTPTMDKLAKNGLRYTQFHTTALCSPTRAALLTGRNHHSVATGVIQEAGTGFPGYSGIIPKSAGTFSKILQDYGYATAWFGKNHNVPYWFPNQAHYDFSRTMRWHIHSLAKFSRKFLHFLV